jgi:hypothetical protein
VTPPKLNFLRRFSRNPAKPPKNRLWEQSDRNRQLYNLSVNKNNGIYNRGYNFDIEKKLSVEVSYQGFKEAKGGLRLNLTHVAHECKVSPYYLRAGDGE